MLKKAITVYCKLPERCINKLKDLENCIIRSHGSKYSIPKKFFLSAGIYTINEFAFMFICDVLIHFNVESGNHKADDSDEEEFVKHQADLDNRNRFSV